VTKSTPQPNLLFIFPDQMRLQALGIWRQPGYQEAIRGLTDPVHTPALDKLAKESVLFTQASSTHPVCSPYRAMFMFGMYPDRNGVAMNCHSGRDHGLKHDIPCFTDVLSDAGYETAYIGKTHWEKTEPLFDEDANYVGTTTAPGGHYMNAFDTYIPPGRGRHGNAYWFQNIKDSHHNPNSYATDPDLVDGKEDGQVHRPGRFTPILEADAIVDYLENKKGQRTQNKPFSLIWSPNPPHSPYMSVEDCDAEVFEAHYKDVTIDTLLNGPNVKNPETGENRARTAAPFYFSLVTSIDQQVSRVLAALEASGEADNTLVVFTSDHGDMMGSHGLMGKNVIYDESFRVPFMIRYPEVLKHRLEDLMISPVDIMPTLLGLLGLSEKIPTTVQGTDYSQGILTNEYAKQPKPFSALFLTPNKKGLRTPRYTYLIDEDGEIELYDTTADPYQMTNLPPNTIDASDLGFLQKELGNWLKKSDDAWYKNQEHRALITYPTVW
jgi:arylsulfatase A-like enzyme